MIWLVAIVSLVLIFMFPRQFGYLVGFLLITGGGLFLYSKHIDEQKRLEKEAVKVEISHHLGDGICDAEKPISIVITNTAKRAVHEIEFRIEAFRPGYSQPVNDDYPYRAKFKTDKIIAPGAQAGWCRSELKIKSELDPSTLRYQARYKWITFAD